jgi:hypothetical protein
VFRKLFAITLMLIYIPAIAGVGFSTHYCFGEPKETKVFSVSKQSCCCSESDQDQAEDQGCCSDDIQVIRLNNDHQSSGLRLAFKPLVLDLFTVPAQTPSIVATHPAQFIPAKGFSFAPLPPDKNILFCCYRI